MSKPRVLLISPQFRVVKASCSIFSKNTHRRAQPLLGIGSLATVLHDQGFPVQYLDTVIEGIEETHEFDDATNYYGLSHGEVVERVKDFQPDIVGLSCLFTSQFPLALHIATAIKLEYPQIPIVVGGNHASLNAKEMLQYDCFDYVLKGEGEFAFPLWVDFILHGSGLDVESREHHHRVTKLDDVPPFNWDLVPLHAYWDKGLPQNPFSKSKKAILYETSRGCPEKCIFCSTAQFFGKKFRPKSADRVVSEITAAVKKYGIEEVQFADDNIALDIKRFLAILDGLVPLGIHLCAPSGVRLDHHYKSDEAIQNIYTKMKAAGFYQITFAPESGNAYILNEVIKKHLDLGKMQRLIAIAKEFGFKTHAFFIIGFPYETREQIQDTFTFAEDLACDSYSFSLATPFPPTELWKWCERDHLIIEGVKESDFLLGRSVIKRFDDLKPEDLEVMAEEVSRRLNK